jgi:hypothetical protein
MAKHFYRGYELEIYTDLKSKSIVYDVFRNRQYVLAGFSFTDRNEAEVLDRLKVKIQELLSQL